MTAVASWALLVVLVLAVVAAVAALTGGDDR